MGTAEGGAAEEVKSLPPSSCRFAGWYDVRDKNGVKRIQETDLELHFTPHGDVDSESDGGKDGGSSRGRSKKAKTGDGVSNAAGKKGAKADKAGTASEAGKAGKAGPCEVHVYRDYRVQAKGSGPFGHFSMDGTARLSEGGAGSSAGSQVLDMELFKIAA